MHLDEVPVPQLGPGEALVAVMASAINYNTVWTSIFEPLRTGTGVNAWRPGDEVVAHCLSVFHAFAAAPRARTGSHDRA